MLTVKEDDTHDIDLSLIDLATNLPCDLTGATVTVQACTRSGTAVALAAVVIGDPGDGLIRHRLTGTLDPGIYAIVVKMVKGGIQTTAPTATMATLKVAPTLP
jgi:hypothetical protein